MANTTFDFTPSFETLMICPSMCQFMANLNGAEEYLKLVSCQMKRSDNVTEIMLHGITTIITNTVKCDSVFKSRLLTPQKNEV